MPEGLLVRGQELVLLPSTSSAIVVAVVVWALQKGCVELPVYEEGSLWLCFSCCSSSWLPARGPPPAAAAGVLSQRSCLLRRCHNQDRPKTVFRRPKGLKTSLTAASKCVELFSLPGSKWSLPAGIIKRLRGRYNEGACCPDQASGWN